MSALGQIPTDQQQQSTESFVRLNRSLSSKSSKSSLLASPSTINKTSISTLETKSSMQENIQTTMKKSRWICSVPLRLLPKLIDIYQGLLKVFDEKNGNNQDEKNKAPFLQQAQSDYENMILAVFKEFKGYPEKVLPAYQGKELDARCKDHFKDFLDNKVKRDLAIGKTPIKELQEERKALSQQTVTANIAHLHELRLAALEVQIQVSKNIEVMKKECFEEMYRTTENNTLFNNYKQYFGSVQCEGSVNAQNEISTSVLEKAERVCRLYYQFYPKIVCESGEFSQKIDLDFLDQCKMSQIFLFNTKHEKQFDKEVFESIIKDLQEKLKTWQTYAKSLGENAKGKCS